MIQKFISYKKQQQSHYLKIISKDSLRKLETNLHKYFTQIQNQNQQLYSLKLTTINRLQYIINQLFSHPQQLILTPFGSFVNNLSLPSSDIDLLIFQNTPFKEDPLQILEQIMEELKYFKWVVSQKPIFNARIPVLKLVIDMGVKFNQFSYQHPPVDYINQKQSYSYLDLKNRNYNFNTQIEVDLSIEKNAFQKPMCFSPMPSGVRSTQYVAQYQCIFPQLTQIILFFKSFLKSKNNKFLNCFVGGISSYTLILLIIAFFLNNTKGYSSYAESIFNILEFYGNTFNPKEKGISFICGRPNMASFFKLENGQQNNYLTLIEPMIGSVLGANSSLFPEIQKEMKIGYKKLLKCSYLDSIKVRQSANLLDILM